MKLFNFHTHARTHNPDIVELVNQYPDEFDAAPGVRFSIGIHPWRIDENRLQRDLDMLESRLFDTNCLAIGECGLDKRIATPIAVQLKVFEAQLLLAEKYQKPVVIHCVAAYQEVVETKKRLSISVPMIIHGFSKNEQVAKSLLGAGFYLSFGKWLLRNPELESAFVSVPDNRIFLETDTSDEGIERVYELAARYKKMAIDDLKQMIASNFKSVFKSDLNQANT